MVTLRDGLLANCWVSFCFGPSPRASRASATRASPSASCSFVPVSMARRRSRALKGHLCLVLALLLATQALHSRLRRGMMFTHKWLWKAVRIVLAAWVKTLFMPVGCVMPGSTGSRCLKRS